MNFNSCKRLFFNTAFFNPIQDGPFWVCSWMGVEEGGSQKSSLPKIVTHILQQQNLAVIPCPKKIQKIFESSDTPLAFC